MTPSNRPGASLVSLLGAVVALGFVGCSEDDAAGDGANTGGTSSGLAGNAGSSPEGGSAGAGLSSADGGASGSSSSGAAGASVSMGAPPACDGQGHQGEGTYYAADGSGNCSFDAAPGDVLVGAMNAIDYADSASCGTCIALQGPKGSIRVRIVDQCPECKKGDVDLHPGAFDQIAEHQAGRVPISWTYVSCGSQGPIAYHFKDGSNPWWTAVQIRNHQNAIAKVEYRDAAGAYHPMVRQSYNYFLEDKGLGEKGPYTLRVTDVFGAVIEDTTIPSIAEGTVASTQQFPACVATP
jgi:expansin